MKSSLKKDTGLVYAGYFLRFLSQIILVPFFGHILGPIGYGNVLATLSLMGIISLVVSYGFYMSGTRGIAVSETREEKSAIFNRQIMGRVLLAPVGLLIGAVGTLCSPTLMANPWLGFLGSLLGVLSAFSPIWLFQGLRQFRTSILLEAIAYPINIFFILAFVRSPEDSLIAIIVLLASNIICLAVSYFFAVKAVDFKRIHWSQGWSEIKEATVFFWSSFSFVFLTTGSTYVLSLMVPTEQVGYYGSAEKFVTFGIHFLSPLGQVLMPTISRLQGENPAAAFGVARKGIALEVAYGLMVPLAGYFLAPYFIPLILGQGFTSSVQLFQIMIWIYPFVTLKHAIGLYILIPLKHERYDLMASACNVVVNLAVALTLVPFLSSKGMAFARIAGDSVALFFALTVLVRKGLVHHLVPEGFSRKRL